MPMCTCGNWYSCNGASYEKESLDLCPACISASNPQSYVNSKEWVQGHIVNDAKSVEES